MFNLNNDDDEDLVDDSDDEDEERNSVWFDPAGILREIIPYL